MDIELTRQYTLPRPLSTTSIALLQQHAPNNSVSVDVSNNNTPHIYSIPDSNELLVLKADLEGLLPLTENRIRELRRDFSQLQNIKIVDDKQPNRNITDMQPSTDNNNNNTPDHQSSVSKSEMSRQAALETIRRRRRREETESPDNVSGRSESPHPTLVKLKRSDSSTPSKSTDTKKKRRMSITPTRAYTTGDKQGKHHQKQKSYNTNKQQQKDELDFVRVKPKDQVPILTFWSAMEPYFRPITEEDREFLMKKADNAKPYIIPPLGQHYTEQWAEEDQVINYNSPIHHSRQNSIDSSSINNHVNTHINTHNNNHNISNNNNNNKLKYVQDNITDDQLLEDDLTCGGLTERLLSSLVMEDIIDSSEMQQEDEGEEQPRTAITADVIVSFEERLRRELRYAGLFGDEDIDWNANEDDEICAELRSLGRELKEQVKVNDFRKKRLLQVVDCQLQFDQYRHVLDTLDAQVEQGYMKRFRTQKSKKRRHNTGIKSTLSENALYAMEKRKTWIDALGNIFKDKNLTMPSKSIYSEDIT